MINPIKAAEAANSAFSDHIRCSEQEWTVLAAVLDDQHAVVAMGTGLKCMPECKLTCQSTQLPLYYDTVRDMHAEVVCRRAFVRYLMLNPDKRVHRHHLYLTLAPCGDASMPADPGPGASFPPKGPCILGRGREDWSQRGVVRTKPGRGDAPPTKSVSCSDKMALWNVLGVQGSYFPERVLFATVVVDDPGANIAQLNDSLKGRVGLTEAEEPRIVVSDSGLFRHGPSEGLRRSSISYAWHLGMQRPEVIADGRRLGAIGPANGRLPAKSVSCIASSSLRALAGSNADNGAYLNAKKECIDRCLKGWPRAGDLYSCNNANLFTQ